MSHKKTRPQLYPRGGVEKSLIQIFYTPFYIDFEVLLRIDVYLHFCGLVPSSIHFEEF